MQPDMPSEKVHRQTRFILGPDADVIEVDSDDFELNPKKPLVLLLGNITHEGVTSALAAAGRQYKQKYPESSVKNWRSILSYFGKFSVKEVIWKVSPSTYVVLADSQYSFLVEQLLSEITARPHLLLVHQDLLSGRLDTDRFGVVKQAIIAKVNEWFDRFKLHVLPYAKNAEATVLAAEFVAQTEQGLLLRVYVPTGRMWSNETDRLLQLFRDYLAKVSKLQVRLDQRRTDRGIIYEFHGNLDPLSCDLSDEFNKFSEFFDLCATDPDRAREILAAYNIPVRDVSDILTRYSKEARRLQVDMKHDRESKLLSIRQRLESELVDVLPVTSQSIDMLVNSIVPPLSGIGSAIQVDQNPLQITGPANVTVNLKPQFVNAAASIIAQEIRGDVHLTEQDQELLKLIRKYQPDEATQLASAVHELADPSAPKGGRLLARQRLNKFLIHLGSKVEDVALGVLQSYVTTRMGM